MAVSGALEHDRIGESATRRDENVRPFNRGIASAPIHRLHER
jgi:hypothetical protein